MSKHSEEATKEAARKAVTEGLTDPDTIRLLSAAGDAAKKNRATGPLSSRTQQKKQSANDKPDDYVKVNETDKEEQKPSG